ncbi:MAG TPA: MFS transporter [Candidatus Acidoferrum sp.]|jgi:MFS family permease
MSPLLALLAFSVFINYIDRGNLSIAAPMLKDELGLNGAQLGILLSSFFWTYGLFQILSGWLVDRFRVGWVMAVGFFLWSAATSVTGLLHSFTALLLVRVVLGMGESVAYPSYSKIFARFIPETNRGFANAAIASGLACGPAFGMLLGGTLMSRFGWRPVFVFMGLISLLWLGPWFKWMPRESDTALENRTDRSPGMLGIVRQRSAWGSFVGLFCNGYSLYLLIAWLPFYLVRERHFSMDSMAKIGGAVFLAQALCSTICGRLSDRWIAGGSSPTRVHKTFMVVGSAGTGTFLVASSLVSPAVCVILLVLVGISLGMSISNVWPMTQRLAGPRASGRWTGLQCAFGNLSGAVTSAVTGLVLDRTGHFFWAFVVAAGFLCVGVLSWIFIVGPIQAIEWPLSSSVRLHENAAKSAVANHLDGLQKGRA